MLLLEGLIWRALDSIAVLAAKVMHFLQGSSGWQRSGTLFMPVD